MPSLHLVKTLQLFFVRADNEDGESHDLFVWAYNADQAKHWWLEYYSLNRSTVPEWVTPLPAIAPPGTRDGAIHWGDLLKKKVSWPEPAVA